MRRRMLVPVVATAVVLSACTDSGDDGASDTTAPATETTSDGSVFERIEGTDPAGAQEAAEPQSTETEPTPAPTTTVIDTVPDTGVPGIDSGDAFCRSWSEFAGSFQALALATAVDPGDRPPRLEVTASDALLAAVSGLDEHLPAELEAERDALVVELAGPMARRAETARAELLAAGLTEEEVALLGTAWLAALAESGFADDVVDPVVPDGVDDAAFDAAVTAFAGAIPPINEDPSLITDAAVPQTEAYLSANCPDQGTLGGNDIVDQV